MSLEKIIFAMLCILFVGYFALIIVDAKQAGAQEERVDSARLLQEMKARQEILQLIK
jgi:uncharacterized membrane protein YsdA (DUF1294 family)